MKDDDKTEQAAKKDDKPKRLALSKRVIKHLVVKSNVKTGWPDGTRCCTNHNATKAERGVENEDKPKRLVLNKRVIKHLVVKSSVRTGVSAYCEGGRSETCPDGTRCCTNHNATKIRR